MQRLKSRKIQVRSDCFYFKEVKNYIWIAGTQSLKAPADSAKQFGKHYDRYAKVAMKRRGWEQGAKAEL